MSAPTGPLQGIRILDLTAILFGPSGTQMLGDWGAEVIKVESLAGDGWRYTGQFRNRGMSGQFMAVNRSKRSLALDLKHPDGKEALLRRPGKGAITSMDWSATGKLLAFASEAGDCGIIDISA